MTISINPFVISGRIPRQYFCDREKEATRLIQCIQNQENVVLMSPRRMGKTKLIDYCFEDDAIRDDYYTITVDILQTASLGEFIQALGVAVYKQLARRSERLHKLFTATLRSLSASFGYDPVQNTPTFDIKLGDISRPDYTLDEIFDYIEKADKRCIIAIDEFQQITQYPEKNVEAILRTHVQRSANANFIFSGSMRHILEEMFMSYARPFYLSATFIRLDAIPLDLYTNFVKKHFSEAGKAIDADAVATIYQEYDGVTYYLQRIMHDCFSATLPETTCTKEVTELFSNRFIEENDTRLREQLSKISERQKALLYAICDEGTADHITSSSFVKKHNLRSQSSVQSAIKQLLSMDLITEQEQQYRLSDPLLRNWLKQLL